MNIRPAERGDVPLILSFIKELAAYEKMSSEVTATESLLTETLFGAKPYAEVVIAEISAEAVGFALYFHNYSTFLGKPGIYLEDLFVLEQFRGQGVGEKLLSYLAALCIERNCGRLEWSVLNWNTAAIEFYQSRGAEIQDEWLINRVTGDALTQLAQRHA